MTKSTITRERAQQIFLGNGPEPSASEERELARMALAAMDSEPVFTLEVARADYKGQKLGNHFGFTTLDAARKLKEGNYQLYRHAQPAPVVSADLLHSAASAIEDLLTTKDRTGAGVWFDLPFKLRSAANAQPVPERDQVRSEHAEWSQATFGNVSPVGPLKHLSKEALEAAAEPGDLSEWADMQFLLWDAQRRAGITDDQITLAMIDKLAVNKQRKWPEPKDGEPRLHIKEQSAPVVPDGYVMVPMRLTAENGAKGALSGEFSETKFVNCPECFGADECETCDGSGRIEITVPVTWTTIKEIWAKGVEHFSAAPQEVKGE